VRFGALNPNPNPETEPPMQDRTLDLISVAFEWSETHTDADDKRTRTTVRLRLGSVEVIDSALSWAHARRGCLFKLNALATALTGEVQPVPDTGWTDDTGFICSALEIFARFP
jgi:hypothetical protein